MQVAIYARVSTGKQAENDLSIPDQLRQIRQWAERQGHIVVKEYIEPGASATDDRRPVFQTMISDSSQKPSPFQIIAVHSFSRFFRDHIEGAIYQRKLGKYGVRIESITQHTNNDPSGEMHRSMIMLFDEYQSKENAKHTLRGMKENARQGYYNGSTPPYGYRTVEAGQTGTRGRIKKKLEINQAEAEIVKNIYEMYVHGRNNMPRMGMKEIAKTLNEQGITMRGRPWRAQKICNMLSETTYMGLHVFNQESASTRRPKDESEWVKVPVPSIIDQELYEKAKQLRKAFPLRKADPLFIKTPNLLSGLLKCNCCGSTMVMTGSGKGKEYRYYKCSNRLSKGNSVCTSATYPSNILDDLVLKIFRDKILTPQYIHAVIDTLKTHANENKGIDQQRTKKLEAEIKDIEQAENKLFEAVEKGILELDERLKVRVQQHKARREALRGELESLQCQAQAPLHEITSHKIDVVTKVMNRRFSSSTPFSRAYLCAVVSDIRVVGNHLKLSGEYKDIENLIAANGRINPAQKVRGSIYGWRPLIDAVRKDYRQNMLSLNKILPPSLG